MFIGEYSHTVDQKGRMAVPSKFRRELRDGAVVTRGVDKCLFVYTREEWRALAEKLSNLPISDPKARAFARLMLAGAMDVSFDRQGRILLPKYLQDYAGIRKKAVVAGLYSRLEVWDETKWQNYKKKKESETEKIAKHMTELGI